VIPGAPAIAAALCLTASAGVCAQDAAALHTQANSYRAEGRYEQALEAYNAAIALQPALIDAIPDFTRVIDVDPKSAYAYYNRGLCYEGLRLDDLAIEDISAAIGLDPRAEFRYERRATIYFRKGQLDRALADYEQALAINPQYAAALYGRGTIRQKQGDLAAGGADIASAQHFQGDIGDQMRRAGVRP
jgi:tetratricopeptide (TPR) repeat protein